MSSQALCVKLSVLFGVVCHYFTKRTDVASKQRQAFRMCILLCPRYLMGGDTQIIVLPVWEKSMHGQRSRALAVSTAMCFPCGRSDPAWRSFARTVRLAFPRALVPRLQSWGLQSDLYAEVETGTAFSLPSPDRFSASSQGWEACTAVSSAPIEAQTLQISDSEELDVVSANAKYTENSPPQSHAYEELRL